MFPPGFGSGFGQGRGNGAPSGAPALTCFICGLPSHIAANCPKTKKYSKGSDYGIRDVESVKFKKDARSSCPVKSSVTHRLIALALNHLCLRGGNFHDILKEFATILVTRPGGCSLLQGPFALSINDALHKILNTWGSLLTWTAQREHAAHIVGAMDAFYAGAHFLFVLDQLAA